MGLFLFMNYREQLLTEDWNRKRTEILLRDNFKCRTVGCKIQYEGVEVHHLEYFSHLMAWEYSNSLLVTLCHKHHSDHHQGIKLAEKALTATLRSKGFLLGDLLALSTLVDTNEEFTITLLKTLAEQQNG